MPGTPGRLTPLDLPHVTLSGAETITIITFEASSTEKVCIDLCQLVSI